MTRGEFRLKERTGRKLPKEKLWSAIDRAAIDQPSMSLLVARLRAENISVRLRAQNGNTTGVSYEIDGIAFPGYKLGKAYSFNGLQRHLGVSHLPEQEEALKELTQINTGEVKASSDKPEDFGIWERNIGEHRPTPLTGLEPPKEKLRKAIDQAAIDRPSMSVLIARLRSQDIAVRLRQAKGKTTGISYELDGIAFSGYTLGKEYSFNGLQRHLGVSHLPEQDQQLQKLSQMSVQEANQLS